MNRVSAFAQRPSQGAAEQNRKCKWIHKTREVRSAVNIMKQAGAQEQEEVARAGKSLSEEATLEQTEEGLWYLRGRSSRRNQPE